MILLQTEMGRCVAIAVSSCLLYLMLSCCSGWATSEPLHETGADDCVVDITDMMDYDPTTQKSARCERLRHEKELARSRCNEDLEKKLEETQRYLSECRNEASIKLGSPPPPCESGCPDAPPCPESASADEMFFRRITRHLVNVLEEKAPDTGPVEAQIEVHLTSHEWRKLKGFVNGKAVYRKADIHDILVGMTIEVFHFNQTSVLEWLGDQINLKSPGIILLLLSVTVVMLVFGTGMYSDIWWNWRFRGCLLTAILLISIMWNWIYLYQEETIKRYRNAQKYEDIPAQCMPHKMTWVQTLSEWFRTMTTVKTDDCFEYNRLYLVDPLFDIPPTRALSFTLSSMFVDPMKYLGRAVSEFHREIFGDLPLWAAIPALCSCYVFMFLALYAFVSAPRRVHREPPHPDVGAGVAVHGRGRPPAAVEPPVEPQLAIGKERDERDQRGYGDDAEGSRVENVRPPTLPPVNVKPKRNQNNGEQRNPPDLPPGPHDHRPQESVGDRSTHGISDTQEMRNQPHRGCSGPADHSVKPKTLRRRQHSPTVDGNETDESRLSSGYPFSGNVTSRPTNLRGFGRSEPWRLRSVGDTCSGNPTDHPSSEVSDKEYMAMSRSTLSELEPEASLFSDSHSVAEETTYMECATPSSIDSPSDVSVISLSPENITNSASYDFITTSSIGLAEEAASPSQDLGTRGGEDSEDDFVVLKTER